MTSIDRRLKHVELRRVPRIVKDGSLSAIKFTADVQALLSKSEQSTDIADTTGVGTVAPTFIAQPYISVIKVEYRGYNLGDLDDDRATVYFDGDPGAVAGDYMMFSGFTTFLDISGSTGVEYKVTEAGVVVGGDFDGKHYIRYFPGRKEVQRATLTLIKGVRIRAANVTVAGGVLDGGTTTYSLGSITYDVGAGGTSDLTYGPNWVGDPAGSGSRFTEYAYSAGDDISIDGLGAPFDGTFKVASSTKTGDLVTLQYTLNTPVVGPVTLPTTDGAIRAAGARLIRNGETYTDTSSGAAITYVWDDKLNKWWNPADLELPEGIIVDDGIAPSAPTSLSGTSTGYSSNGPKAKVELTWTAPTTNAGGTPLTDLMGYKLYYKLTSQTGDYAFVSDTGVTASGTVLNLVSETSYSFVVTAYDKAKREGVYSTAFTITTAKGALDLDRPSAPVLTSRLGVITVKWNGNNSSGLSMAGSTTLTVLEVHRSTTTGFTPGTTTLIATVPRSTPTYIDSAVEYNTNYHYVLIAKDVFDNKSIASAQSILQVKPLVDTDLVASTLTTWPFNGKVVNALALADGSVSGSTLISGTPESGVWSVGALVAGSIAANDMAANSIIAGKIAANAVTANSIAANAITADKINVNAITADKINAGAVNAEKIEAGAISAGKILATDTFTYTNSNGTASVKIGGNSVSSSPDTPGLSIVQSGTSVGWIGGWGSSDLEIGTNFTDCYIDFYSASNSIYAYTDGNFSVSSVGDVVLSSDGLMEIYGSTVNLYGPVVAKSALTVTLSTVLKSALTVDGRIYGAGTAAATKLASTAISNMFMSTTGLITLINNGSSRAFKKDIREIDFDSEKYLAIKPVYFTYKIDTLDLAPEEEGVVHVGFIAEDFADIGIETVVVRNENNKVVNLHYDKMTAFLHKIVADQNERIKALEAINKLQGSE